MDLTPEQEAFGARLEATRRYHGRRTNRSRLKQNAFAEELGVEANRYRRWERGEIEPPLAALRAIRRLTGLSLDWLICDLPPGAASIPSIPATPADRLHWARELREPNAAVAAQVMSVSIPLWNAYESGQTPIPLPVAQEFSRRFGVSLDYLYDGRLEGVQPAMRDALLARRPQLLAQVQPRNTEDHPLHTDTVPRGDNTGSERSRA